MAGRVQAAMQTASRLTKQGNPSAALAIYDQLVLSLPKNQRVRAARAQLIARCEAPTAAQMQALAALNEAGDWGGLLQLCHRLAQTCPAAEAVWTYRGAAALQLGDAAVAVHAFARAVEEFAAVGHTLGIESEAVPPFPFLAMENHPARQRQRSERFAASWAVAPRPAAVAVREKIRIGYFSADFFAHAVLHLLNGLIEAHVAAACGSTQSGGVAA